jgi:Ca-activated chloride channel homolog
MTQQMQVSVALSQGYLHPMMDQTVYMMVRLTQSPLQLGEERSPLNIGFVLDRSGSMAGSKLAHTKKAVSFALGHLNMADTASVVVFDDQVQVLLAPEKVIQKDAMIQTVNSLGPGGCTNLSGGLLKGAALVREHLEEGHVNRVILLTDGLANRGVTHPARITEMVKGLAENRVSLSTMGVGADFQEDLLVDMAEAGAGNFYFIESPDQIPAIFQQELQGLLSVTAKNLSLSFLPRPGVSVLGVMGYEPQWGEEVSVMLPDMVGGEVKTVLFALQVSAGPEGTLPLGQLTLRYDDVAVKLAAVTYKADVDVSVTYDGSLIETGYSLHVMKEVEIFRTAEVKEQAIKMADHGKFAEAAQIIREQRRRLEGLLGKEEDAELRGELDALESSEAMVNEDLFDPIRRKTIKAESFQSRRKR